MNEQPGLEIIKELKIGQAWREWNWRRWVFAAILFTALISFLVSDFIPDKITGIQPGKPSPTTVKAPRDIRVVDDAATAQRRGDAAKAIGKVYNFIPNAKTNSIDEVHRAFTPIRASKSPGVEKKAVQVHENLTKDQFDRVSNLTFEQIEQVEARVVSLLERLYLEQITADDIAAKKDKLVKAAYEGSADSATNQLVGDVASEFLVANYVYDEERTEELRRDAVASVEPVTIQKQKGEEIVGEGKIVTETHIRLLRELGLLGQRIDFTKLVGFVLMSLAIISAFALYLHNYQRRVFENGRLLLVLGLILIGTLSIGKIAVSFSMPYLVPVVAAGMIATLIFSVELATGVIIVTGLNAGLMAGQDFRFVLIWLLGGLFAAHTVGHIKHRTDLARAGAVVSLAVGGLSVSSTLLGPSVTVEELVKSLGWGLASGMYASVLTIGVLPFLEKMFGLTTDVRLVELSYANQPILRDLMMNAPGTYNHSVMTGNLAESAAEEVGANPLLARVGAYYHDIGKMKRPLFFVENQTGGENPHDNTNPNLSCLIITNHVKDGVEIAESNGLPGEIIDIVKEHHGTSIVSYFYHRAKENSIKQEVFESDFRYSGAKPKSREGALVMLADSVEAAARTIAKPTPNRLEQLIKRVIQHKLDDGQLSESDLTLRDLDTIAKCFGKVLTSFYHTRVEYPMPVAVKNHEHILK
ncbi:MAG: HD family phosphohydrolase [Candidatus Aquicultorales bacterium]